ncbi:MAG TPA: hypothetical protein VG167_14950 [Verrucomicrobiae bacterium]|nr:hypothetical protein [Verrucomicrobiae bacterium]
MKARLSLCVCVALVLLAGGIFGWRATSNTGTSKPDAAGTPQPSPELADQPPVPASAHQSSVSGKVPQAPDNPLDEYGDPVRYWVRVGTNTFPNTNVPPEIRRAFPNGADTFIFYTGTNGTAPP